jgi:hypothetical protein
MTRCGRVALGALLAYVWSCALLDLATQRTTLPHLQEARSIAIVGNAPSLLHGARGREIDDADFVVRFNTFVLVPRETGARTSMHVITSNSPRQCSRAAASCIAVSNTRWHDIIHPFPHPNSFHLRNRGLARLLPDSDYAGPSSGLALSVFAAVVAPRARVRMYGIGHMGRHTSPQRLHYFDARNGSLVDRVIWTAEATLGLHHRNETGLIHDVSAALPNLGGAPPPGNASAADAVAPTPAGFWAGLRGDGFFVERGAFDAAEVAALRDELERRVSDVGLVARFLQRFVNPTGITTVDFIGYAAWYASRYGMYRTATFAQTRVRAWAERRFGANVTFGFHNDVTSQHLTRWHKDRLNDHPVLGRFRRDYEARDPWSGGAYNIFKALVYLQDGAALDVVPGSHVDPAINATGARTINVTVGDVILFDQRLTHRGHSQDTEVSRVLQSLASREHRRMLVTMAIAYADSDHLDGFTRGTRARQQAIFHLTEVSARHAVLALWTLASIALAALCARRCDRVRAPPCYARAVGRDDALSLSVWRRVQ